jgi:MoaA/NifB/PqqE/SkfB family radical SAM enzyme
MEKRAIVKLGYTCNNNCIFCHAKHKKAHGDISFEAVRKKILKLRRLGIEMVLFSGGEPTIRKDIMDIFGFAHVNGFRTGLVTNGRMLQYNQFLSMIQKLGLGYVYTSIHGPEDIHNRITGTRSFRQVLKGIMNVSGVNGIELAVNCVVNGINLDSLEGVIDSLKGIRIDRIKFSLMEPVPQADPSLIPDINRAWESVKAAIAYGEREGFSMGADGFPLCVMKGYEGYIDNLRTNNILYISEAFEDEFFPSDEGNRIKTPFCRGCKLRERCEGTYREYFNSMER